MLQSQVAMVAGGKLDIDKYQLFFKTAQSKQVPMHGKRDLFIKFYKNAESNYSLHFCSAIYVNSVQFLQNSVQSLVIPSQPSYPRG